MSDTESAHGPVDYLIVEWPAGTQPNGEGLKELANLTDRGLIRVLDLVFVTKGEDGTVAGLAIADIDSDGDLDLVEFEGASSGLIGPDDYDDAGGALEPGASAAILLYENRWARGFAEAVQASGAQLVARGGIPGADLAEHRRVTRVRERLGKESQMPLLRGVARVAVISGTATAVSNRVSRRQANRWAQEDQGQQQYQEPAPAAAPAADPLDQLKQLGELKASGVLTDAEFEAQKAKILQGVT